MKYDQQKIEDYVLGKLGEAERATFQFEMMKDPGLKKKVDNLRTIQYVARIGERKPPKSSFHGRSWLLMSLIFLLSLLAFFLLKPSPEKAQEKKETSVTSPTVPSTKATNENKSITKEVPQKKKNRTEKPSKKVTPAKKTSPPIASVDPADFSDNGYWESFGSGALRSADLNVRLHLDSIVMIDEKGQGLLSIQGEVKSSMSPALLFRIFSNKDEDYENDLSIYESILVLQSTEENDQYSYQLEKRLLLQPGKYYAVIEVDEQIIVVDKFMAKP